MLSYTGLRNRYGELTNNASSTNLAQGDIWINENLRQLQRMFEFDFDETSTTDTTVASQQFYALPFNYKKLMSVTITVGNINYTPKEVTNRDMWNRLNQSTAVRSNIPEWYYVQVTSTGPQIGFYPVPSGSGNTITYYYKIRVRDLSIADYATGNVFTTTNGGTTVIGTSTVWTTSMAGRWLRITESDSVNRGDGEWYRISSVTNGTTLILTLPYNGTAINGGAAPYTIGQMPLLPEDYHLLPVYYAANLYWSTNGNNPDRAALYKAEYDALLAELRVDRGQKTVSPVVDMGQNVEMINPNFFITY